MAKISLKLDELIDGEALRRELSALVAKNAASAPETRAAVLNCLKERRATGMTVAEAML